MALINCPNCGQQISEHAKQCIHCGYTLNINSNIQDTATTATKKKNSKTKMVVLIVIAFLVVVGASVGITLAVINSGKSNSNKCKYEGCDNKVYSDGYCIDHYKSAREEDREDSKETSKSDSSNETVEEDKVEAQKFSKDKAISSDTCEFTFTGYTIAKKLEPKNVTKSYVYHYFEASSGNQFIDVKFKIKNKQNSSVRQDEILDSVKVIYDEEYEYRCSFVTIDKDNDFQEYTSIYDISPLETLEYHMLAEVPDEVKNSDKSLVVQVTADGNLYECKLR